MLSLKKRVKNKIFSILKDLLKDKEFKRLLLYIFKEELKKNSKNVELALEFKALYTTAQYVEKNLTNARILSDNFEVIDCAINNTEIDNGIYCEFGVYNGTSLNYIASKISTVVYGFDSFEGLPKDWRTGYESGQFKINKNDLPDFLSNTSLQVGWFEETLPEFIKQNKQPISLIHIDCDIYESTKTIFNFLGNQIVSGSVLIFNEYFNYPTWQQHEYKAFQEFVLERGIKYEYLCYNKNHEQVAIKIINVDNQKNY